MLDLWLWIRPPAEPKPTDVTHQMLTMSAQLFQVELLSISGTVAQLPASFDFVDFILK